MENDEFLKRLILEEESLNEKLTKLISAIHSPGFIDKIGERQFQLLLIQQHSMATYKQILTMRIKDLQNNL